MLKLRTKFHSLPILLLTAVLAVVFGTDAKGQCIPQVRTYANFQGIYETGTGALGLPVLAGSVASANLAADGDPKTASTLSVPIGALNLATATQFLEFTNNGTHATKRDLPANTEVTIKFSLPKEVLGLLSSVSIGSFTNLTSVSKYWPPLVGIGNGNGAGYTAVGQVEYLSGSSLLNLLNGAGEVEVTIKPTASFSGIYLKLGSVLSLGLSANIYHAYIKENSSPLISCNDALDVLAGARAGTAVGGIASVLAPVTTPWDAIDGNLATYAELDVTAQVLNESYHTTIFKTVAQAGDAIQITLRNQGGGLLNLGLLNGFSIQMYNGLTPVGTAMSSTSGLLSLSLLTSGGNDYTVLTIPIAKANGPFDRVEIKIGGVVTASLVSKLRIYEVKRIILPKPTIDGAILDSKTICKNSTSTLSISETQDCTTYNWYNVQTGGSILTTATSYTPLASSLNNGSNIFYVEAVRTNCTETSGRIPVTLTINNILAGTIGNDQTICLGTTPNAFTQTVASGNGIITYQWQKSTNNINFTNISGANSATYTELSTLSQTTYYQRIATSTLNTLECTAISNKIIVATNPLPTASITGSTAVCQNSASPLITFTGGNGTAPYTFSYKIGTGSTQTISTTSGNSVSVSAATTTPGTFTYTLLGVQDSSSTTCSQTQNGTATITINPKPAHPITIISSN
ncbi:immunoglobulin domain-containing protein [Pedobacter sp. GR22-6]|uniref:immunoglobulin domain-containing protein n=1 Tax=Pedobacter sp. GR22-6 TaxID=3127957 RepID=UPI00307CD394